MNVPIIQLSGINKQFPGVHALKNLDFFVNKNEILGLVGENGAGKSTLMKILIGLYQYDEGSMMLGGKETIISNPRDAIKNGIGMVFQEGCMIPNLSIMENLFLCHEESFARFGILSRKKMISSAKEVLSKVNIKLNPEIRMSTISPAAKQMVEIARLLWMSSLYHVENPVLILDEPTTVLLEREVKTLFRILIKLKEETSIIFISHRLEEVVELSDRIVVLKNGEHMASLNRKEARVRKIERLMVGRELSQDHYKESLQSDPGEEVVLKVENLCLKPFFHNFNLSLHYGEIISIVGLIGSGKEEVCKCLMGLRRAESGSIIKDGKKVNLISPKSAIKSRIGYVPIDRRKEGLATDMDVARNINLLVINQFVRGIFISLKRETQNAEYWIKECRIRTPSIMSLCANLSGGNQQKVVIGKWLAADVDILILDHPTRGIDIGAKEEIYRKIRQLAESGMSIIIMSDTIEEDIGLSNGMIIMKDGKIEKEIDCSAKNKPTPLDIIEYIV